MSILFDSNGIALAFSGPPPPYRFAELVDMEQLRDVMATFHEISGLPVGFIDWNGTVVHAVGRSEICEHLHRSSEVQMLRCRESVACLLRTINDGDYARHECSNGFISYAAPIVVEDRVMAAVYLGQFLDAVPETSRFIRKALESGLDRDIYIAALRNVPVLPVWRVETLLRFLVQFGRMMATAGLERRRQEEATHRLEYTSRTLENKLFLTQALIDSFSGPVCYKDTGGVLRGCNPAYEGLVGRSREEIVGKTSADFLAADAAEADRADDRAVLEWEGVRIKESTFVGADGKPQHFIVDKAVFLNADCTVGGTVTTMTDVTERKRTEEAIRESQQRLSLLIEQSPAGVIEWDTEFKVTVWNAAAERIFGYAREETLGRRAAEFIFPDASRDRIRTILRDLMARRGGYRATGKSLAKDGREITCEWYNAPLVDQAGRTVGIVSIVEDITDRLKEQEALRNSEAQLRQSQKMEAVGRLAGGVAHDFNNLLTAIMGYSELLLSKMAEQDPIRREIEEIRKAGERASSLTRQLLAFSRQQVLQPRIVHLNDAIGEIEKMLVRLIGEDIRLETFLSPDLWRIMADPGQIDQVIINLAVNARDAMPGGGRLTIKTRNATFDEGFRQGPMEIPPGDYVVVDIRDTGHGMDEETQQRIFEPFFTTKEKGKGTGLGLSTVYGIVKQSEGFVWVESAPGAGSVFHLCFPRVAKGEAPKDVEGKAPAPRGLRETILVVEDDDLVRALATEILNRNGYRILEATNGADAVSIAKEHAGPIPLMITDVIMPGMSGTELCRAVLSSRPDMAVLFMSGYTGDLLGRRDLLAEGAAFIEKPFTPEQMCRKVREVLEVRNDGHWTGIRETV